MTGKKIIYYLLAAFIAGNILLIYIQYNSTKNINTLISSNEKVLNEIDVSNNLRELKRDIISADSNDVTDSSNTVYSPKDMKAKIEKVQSYLDNLQKISDDDSSVKYIDVLDLLVHKKLSLDKGMQEPANNTDKANAVTATTSGITKVLTDSIRLVTRIIENSRQKLLAKATLSIDKSGSRALNLGTALIVFVLLSGAVSFWIIIATIRKQNQLIHQLNQSEKKVRETAIIKENFMANMSHEIRTPMNAVLGFTNLLQKKELDPEAKQYVQSIQRSGENLLAIINDILDLSKIEAGMMRIEVTPFNIRDLVYSVETMFRAKAQEKELLLSSVIDESLPETMEGDAIRLTQILINLIGNAIKFTTAGEVTIAITNEGADDHIIKTGITVKDTGIGIEKEKFKHIFERFQQAEDTVTRKYGGTGLGLSIVNELVLLQQGSIDVESQPGDGTTFRLIIPYKKSTTHGIEQLIAATITTPMDFGEVCILVVEDNVINQSLVRHLFKNWQLEFDLAKNGKEAIDKLQTKKYSLILMDIQMPEMDGYTCSLEIRHKLKLNTPIIAMTAHAMAGEREKCISYGMNEYISKPVREEQLYNVIADYTHAKAADGIVRDEPGRKIPIGVYNYIDLEYMQEVSQGNIDYEKTVTEQFIEMIPTDLMAIEKAWHAKEIKQLQTIAHNMKTSISVMGLNEILQTCLDALEYDNLTEEQFNHLFAYLQFSCTAALEEASIFKASLQLA